MEIKGLKINFLGDSITEGCGVTDLTQMFSSIFEREYGAVARNYGIGGTRFAPQTNPSENPRFDLDYIMRADEMDKDADVIVVFGGTNDYGHGDAPFGKFGDNTPKTFHGACRVLGTKLINLYPNSKIVFITPLHRIGEFTPKTYEGTTETHTLRDYVYAIKENCEYLSIPVLDLYADGGLQPEIPVIQEKCVPDGLHPNEAGHRILAEKIRDYLLCH